MKNRMQINENISLDMFKDKSCFKENSFTIDAILTDPD